ncbi:MAG: hypothetical protein DLM50_00450 [Candidatus Meridianibacter frigidus]|nr:MAG: hypothetical protein DLM50_00450 [Candidatus Eremiobacteraeota bacterium]
MLIYHTSDLHDHRGIAQPLQALRAAAPGLLLDCGDALRGSQTVYHRSEPIIAEMDAAKYDAQAAGNREFHYLFGAMAARARQMHHPLICTNVVDIKARPLPFIDHLRLDYDGVRLYLTGLLIMQYPVGSPWERLFGWRFLDPDRVIEKHAARVLDGELFVVLSHLGLSLDRKLAEHVPRIDLLLGGHSHDTLHEPQFVNGVPIVHAGPYGRYVSRSDLRRDSAAKRPRLHAFALLPLLPT